MRKALAWIGAVSTAALFAPPPLLARGDELASSTVMKGECRKLVVGDVDHSVICAGVTANFAYRSGQSSFQFAAGKVVAVGFYGADHEADGDEAYITIQKISLNELKGTPSTLNPASGKCTYTNPYAGPSRIQCSAVSLGKAYSATFVSDGEAPSVQRY